MAEFNRAELRKIFEAAEIEVPKDVIGQICELHTESSDGMGESLKELKAKLKKAEQERDDFEAKIPKDGEEMISKSEYDKIKGEYEEYKSGIEKEKLNAEKSKAYRSMIIDAGVSEKYADTILKVADLDKIELSDGKIKNAEKYTESIRSEWSDFIPTERKTGADTKHPPVNGGGKMSRDEIANIKDPTERRKAIAENMEIFEKGE